MATAGFYVYEHLRPDTGQVFYVGKGKGDRAWSSNSRNRHWRNVVAKHGFSVRIVLSTCDEDFALFAEMELIAKHRRMGIRLSNLTDGGEGVVGFSRKQAVDEIAKRIASNTGKRRSDEQKQRISAAKRGHGLGRKLPMETRLRIAEANKGRPNPMPKLRGRSRPAHVRQALSESNDRRYAERRVRITNAIRANPGASAMQIARIAACNRGTVSKYLKQGS